VQVVEAEGEAVFGLGSVEDGTCANCTGVIYFDPASLVDVSDPGTDPDHCDPSILDEYQVNYGLGMTEEAGDFMSLGLIDAAAMATLGLSADVYGVQTSEQLEAELASGGFDFVQAGLVNAVPETISAQAGLDWVANPAEAGSLWYFFWYVYRDPVTNPYEGSDLVGDYYVAAFWQFGGGG
jgi:hypothetical protein